jgi:predicted ATPase
MARDLAADCLALAEKQGATVPLMIGHRMMGSTLFYAGDVVESRAHLDRVIALYDPAKHRAPATRVGVDIGAMALSIRANVLWTLGYPEAALVDAQQALKEARATGQAASLMNAMAMTVWTLVLCGNYETARVQCEELFALADQKGADQWKGAAILHRGVILVLTGNPTDAVQTITSGLAAWQLTGSTLLLRATSAYLARAHAETGHFDDAWRCIDEAMTAVEATKETWHQADIIRMAGEIALKSPTPDATKAEAYFERALTVARSQQAKSWELRAAMSMARLWRDQRKRQEARDLLAPVYGWFTEGFDTLDLKEAKALLDELAA